VGISANLHIGGFMLRRSAKKSNKKLYPYLDINLINAAFSLDVSAAEKSVMIMITSKSRFRNYKYSHELSHMAGCGLSTAKRAIASLVDAGHLFRIKKGEYAVIVKAAEKSYLNIKQFNMGLKLPLQHIEKLVLLSTIKHIPIDRDTCFPKITTISNDCSLSPKSVGSVLTRLKKMGLIDRYKDSNIWYVKSLLGGEEIADKYHSGGVKNSEKVISGGICKNTSYIKRTKVKEKELGQAQHSPPASLLDKQKEEKHSIGIRIINNKKTNPPIAKFFSIWTEALTKYSKNGVTKIDTNEKKELVYIFTAIQDSNYDPLEFINFVLNNWAFCCKEVKYYVGDYKQTKIPKAEYISDNLNLVPHRSAKE
jgi:predicted transcriptional regulator